MSASSQSAPSPRDPAALRRTLLTWYDRERRDLPWRGIDDPYRVLVSEFMLQQTQVATVLPYYDAFLRRFPTFSALADAAEDDVRAAWSGLGYYRRARSLQATAQRVMAEHDGALPADLDALRALPGVGDYTAAALGSIVHGMRAAVVDGNVIRVLTRFLALPDPIERAATKRRLAEEANRLLDPRRPGDFNQAMMELGATVCLPRAPRCEACPWSRRCRARAEGEPERYPVKEAAKPTTPVVRAVGVLRRGRRVLLLRRRDARLLDGTWELPGLDTTPEADAAGALAAHLAELGWRGVRVGAELARVKHSITHRRITVRAYAVRAAATGPSNASARAKTTRHSNTAEPAKATDRSHAAERAWVDGASLAAYPISSMTAKVFRALEKLLTTTGTGGGRAGR